MSCLDVDYIKKIPGCCTKPSYLPLGELGEGAHVIMKQPGMPSLTTSRDPGATERFLIRGGRGMPKSEGHASECLLWSPGVRSWNTKLEKMRQYRLWFLLWHSGSWSFHPNIPFFIRMTTYRFDLQQIVISKCIIFKALRKAWHTVPYFNKPK